MNPIDFLWSIAIKKGIQKGLAALVAFLTAKGTLAALAAHGVTVSVNPDVLAASAAGLLETARNWLKTKYPDSAVSKFL